MALPPEALEQLVAEVTRRVLEELDGDREAWPEWMSAERAARYLDVSVARVRKLQARGLLPHYQEAPGCRVFFNRRELDAAMATLRQGPA